MLLNKINNIISRGENAVEDSEKLFLTTEINDVFRRFDFSDENVRKLTSVFEKLYSSDFADFFADSLDDEIYYRFGIKLLENQKSKGESNRLIAGYLNLLRNSNFLKKIYGKEIFEKLIYDLIRLSNFNVERLFNQRVADYPDKVIFREIKNNEMTSYKWKEVDLKVKEIRSAMGALFKQLNVKNQKVAFLLENDIKTILLDLACLSGGVLNVIIPATSVEENIYYILKQTEVPLVFVSGEKQLNRLSRIIKNIPFIKKIILLNGNSIEENVLSFDEFLNFADGKDLINKLTIDAPATIMYTSGTTGKPKGIIFSNLNLIFKRFCRALALPEIGERDRFLSYLPLFHTFGRFLEMLGAVFWGAEYVKMENPSIETLLKSMKIAHPTVFISIPRKWMQLYEQIQAVVDIELNDLSEIKTAVKNITGGNLKWGLSAAGYLPSEIFEFFRKNGIELMSGFGMTEATGGITMTPPGKYKINSLGKALPGINIKLNTDGELLIKGGYVMQGYFGIENKKVFDVNGWLPTGDVMVMDEEGFVKIVDRKKEIYKNVKGETIAPQKIENYFKDFETVKQVFLIGDHKPFNTALIYPDYSSDYDLINLSERELKEYFSSVIITVNKFLAPFERILDFRIINRPFMQEKGELTPKGTFKRKTIEKNFKELIREMYISNHYELVFNGIIIRVPNWFLRVKGVLISDVKIVNRFLKISNSKIKIEKVENNKIRFGDYVYLIKRNIFDLHHILTNPILWLGNKELVDFASGSIESWAREYSATDIRVIKRINKRNIQNEKGTILEQYLKAGETSLKALHIAFLALASDDYNAANNAFKLVKMLALDKSLANHNAAIYLLKNPQLIKSKEIIKSCFLLVINIVKEEKELSDLISIYLRTHTNLFAGQLRKKLIGGKIVKKRFSVFKNILEKSIEEFANKSDNSSVIFNLMKLFLEFSRTHPVYYKEIRRIFVKYQLKKELPIISEYAFKIRHKCRAYFRSWLGENQIIAVDPETGEEYEWKDVIVISEEVEEMDKSTIIKAFTETPIVRESIFLFNTGVLIRLNDILPGGVWVSLISEYKNGKYYRVTIQTRTQGAFEMVVIIDNKTEEEKLKEEINWNILAANKDYLFGSVAEFGGYWDKFRMWSVEYLEEETVARYLYRKNKLPEEKNKIRLYFLFPYFVWSAAAAYFGFWEISQRKVFISDASPENFKIPHHDYQSGAKIISLQEREYFSTIYSLVNNFFEKFILSSFKLYPYLTRQTVWYYLFSGLFEAVGLNEGKKILLELKKELQTSNINDFWATGKERLEKYLDSIQKRGFIPRQLFFAIKRFLRWYKLNEFANAKAKAEMIDELFETYNLSKLEKEYPAVRVVLYLKTVFNNSSDRVKEFLVSLINEFIKNRPAKEEIEKIILQEGILDQCTDEEKYFLTRLAYPHLKANDYAEIIREDWQGVPQFNLVVQFTDKEGNKFFVRRPNSPKEISRLHSLFASINMFVNFRAGNEFLVAVSERGFVIGGLFYHKENLDKIHMEKIIVSHPFRRKGVSEALMNEFFNRSRNEGVKYITTGFFRPEYFYKFGFKVEPKYSGLVKKL